MASFSLHDLIQNLPFITIFSSFIFFNQPNHYSEVLQLYSSMNYTNS